MPLFAPPQENPEYLKNQIITYIGNKRSLLGYIADALETVRDELGKERLTMADLFSGSGIVARLFKGYASELIVNDIEPYSTLINSCYLTNRSQVDWALLEQTLHELNWRILEHWGPGFISELYAPQKEHRIQRGERVFYTVRNANFIDTARREIAALPQDIQKFFLGPLLTEASIHVNTAGIFKGFYKNAEGIGQYGGTGQNALLRIRGDISLSLPILSNYECDCQILEMDAAEASKSIGHTLDLVYLDPPYNQHPYGSNYFMLNTILSYKRPEKISQVSGIPEGWNHSDYNKKQKAKNVFFDLIRGIDSRYILISYNSEGFISYDEITECLSSLGTLKTVSLDYNTFRGCRNLNNRDIHVQEHLFLLKREH